MIKTLAISLLIILISSCGKYECVKNSSPEMIGDWVHYSENNGFHYIYIQENGRGSMYGKNNHGNNQDTQRRGWYIKDDILYFSRLFNKAEEDKFIIDKYPTIATQVIISDYNTVEVNDTYMILNNRIYTKIN